MVYINLPADDYHHKLYVTKENLLAAGFSAVPAVFLVYFALAFHRRLNLFLSTCKVVIFH